MTAPNRHRRLAFFVALVALVAASVTWAGRAIFRWTDDEGVTHYEDSSGGPPANAERLRADEAYATAPMSDLVVERQGDVSNVYVTNRLGGPMQATVAFTSAHRVAAEPGMPINLVVPPTGSGRVLVGQIRDLDATSSFSIAMKSLPGNPGAMPRDVSYGLPVDEHSDWALGQPFHGSFSHNDEQNRYAIDIVVPEGTPVLAARGGVVMQAESGFDRGGLDARKYAERANLIRILHDDGSMGLYAHLQENGVYVAVGERVTVGQQIGVSGNTGFTSGPHLHFAVQVNRGMRLASIPFRMVGPNGYLGLH